MKRKFFARSLFAAVILAGVLLSGFGAPLASAVGFGASLSDESISFDPSLSKESIDILDIKDIQKELEKVDRPILRPVYPPLVEEEEEPEEEEPKEPLPKAYCLRDEYIVFAQHQDKNGLCWNFAATMAASTTIMKATNEYYDFSELWTSVVCYSPLKKYSKVGAGGSFSYQQSAMQKQGLMLESDFPYQGSYIISNDNAAEYYNYYRQYSNDDLAGTLVADSDTSYSRSEVEEIKRHIYEHGSLYMAFTFRTGFLEEDGVYALTPNQKNTTSNHAISVIGWDDNYEREFYLDGSDTPTVYKGAWLVLNSYTETSGTDGISLIFYEDTNIYQIKGYRYEKDTDKPLYFYDKIESGYAYPTNVKGKYYGDLSAETAPTKQLNIFYDDVALEYSYEISSGSAIQGIEIYLDNRDVTREFDVRIDEAEKRFYIEREGAPYGHYKVLVRYGDGQQSDTYLNNFFVTYGLVGEELEFNNESNSLGFTSGRELEYYSYMTSAKNYVIYTNQLSGSVSFLPIEQSVYSEKNMSLPAISYEITDGKSCTVTHSITSESGYVLDYNFIFVYCADTSMQTVNVFYDLDGGTNHRENYAKELANGETDLLLYAPTRKGYVFAGWYIKSGDDYVAVPKDGDVYRVKWEDIYHLGEDPAIYALSYYKQYYGNSSTLFVYARWEKPECTVTWLDWNGNVLFSDVGICGENPPYLGESPERASDERYSYEFIGWSQDIDAESGDTTYTALFTPVPKQYSVTVAPAVNGTVTAGKDGTLTCLDSLTYVFTPEKGYRVKDVKINGTSVGALTSYTFTDVCADQTLSVEFEREPSALWTVVGLIGLSAVAVGGSTVAIVLGVRMRRMRGACPTDTTDPSPEEPGEV